jgi:proprotein convertase subtilisin/kexin type 5
LAQIIDSTTDIGSSPTDYTNAAFYLSCQSVSTYHCQSCNSNSTCISCYQPLTYNSNIYTFDNYIYLTSDFKCVTECGTGYYIDNSTGICTVCSSPCATCQSSAANCLSCLQNITNKFYYSANNSCLTVCPSGQYGDASNKCQNCSSFCFSCQTNSYTCTSCSNLTFLSSSTNTCVSSTSCPTNTFADLSSN